MKETPSTKAIELLEQLSPESRDKVVKLAARKLALQAFEELAEKHRQAGTIPKQLWLRQIMGIEAPSQDEPQTGDPAPGEQQY